jgi:phosphoglucosamine mutase
MMAVCVRAMQAAGKLKGNAVVGTIITNAGMDIFAEKHGFTFHRADVGDKNVLEMMLMTGASIGGETSGHLIFLDDATTGDGQLAAVKFLNVLAQSGKTASELVSDVPNFPQVMPSYHLTGGEEEKEAIMSSPKLRDEIARQEKLLDGQGRIIIRPSGTEAIIRVLVEAKCAETAAKKAQELIDFIGSL